MQEIRIRKNAIPRTGVAIELCTAVKEIAARKLGEMIKFRIAIEMHAASNPTIMMHNLRATRVMRADPHPTLRTHTVIRTTPRSTPRLTRAAATPRNMLPSLDIFCDIL
jgi:hypothetical protein